MKLIRPSVEWLNPKPGIEILKAIEKAGRTCYKSEDKITDDSCLKFVKRLFDRGHHAMFEHGGDISMKFITDRGISHEIVRHRHFSFAQESTRYCDYDNKDIEFIIPSWITKDVVGKYSRDCYENPFNGPTELAEDLWYKQCVGSETIYKMLLIYGWSPQQARSVLPNSLKTEILVTGNPRCWINFFELRDSPAAHQDMQVVAKMARDVLSKEIPILFDKVDKGDQTK